MNPALPPQPSLQGMRDILLPPPVPLWPATPAWGVLGLLLAALLLWLGWRWWRHWRREAYRRAALRALPAMDATTLPALVKRTALAGFPRATVAALAGEDWAAFLRRTGGLGAAQAGGLARLAYLDPAAAQAALPAAREAARHWITRHDRAA